MDGTYLREGRQIAKGGHILIGGRPCKVTKVSYSTGKYDKYNCVYEAYDIFTYEKRTTQCRATDPIECPNVADSLYHFLWITDQGQVILKTHVGHRRDPLYLPPTLPDGDVTPTIGFVAHYQNKLRNGIKLSLQVKSSMGEEHICGISERNRDRDEILDQDSDTE